MPRRLLEDFFPWSASRGPEQSPPIPWRSAQLAVLTLADDVVAELPLAAAVEAFLAPVLPRFLTLSLMPSRMPSDTAAKIVKNILPIPLPVTSPPRSIKCSAIPLAFRCFKTARASSALRKARSSLADTTMSPVQPEAACLLACSQAVCRH